mmetsp:Transcript_63109/g.112164  ORF Transcript_63109/g.112164 Transcript_63109/m.112164 type:complete len:129 (+) Transcript_63109:124-510(+)
MVGTGVATGCVIGTGSEESSADGSLAGSEVAGGASGSVCGREVAAGSVGGGEVDGGSPVGGVLCFDAFRTPSDSTKEDASSAPTPTDSERDAPGRFGSVETAKRLFINLMLSDRCCPDACGGAWGGGC